MSLIHAQNAFHGETDYYSLQHISVEHMDSL